MTFAVLIGLGPNDMAIPCLVFHSMDKALIECKDFLGEPKIHGARYYWSFDEKPEERQLQKTFTNYYGGCGECYSYVLQEVKEGLPFVGWDLD